MSRDQIVEIQKALNEAVPKLQARIEDFLKSELPQDDFSYMVMYIALNQIGQKIAPFAAELSKRVLATADKDHLTIVKTQGEIS